MLHVLTQDLKPFKRGDVFDTVDIGQKPIQFNCVGGKFVQIVEGDGSYYRACCVTDSEPPGYIPKNILIPVKELLDFWEWDER